MLSDEQLRVLLSDEQEEDHRLRWQVLQAQTPGETLARPAWMDPYESPIILTPEILDILGDVPLRWEIHDGLPVYWAA